MTIQEEVAKVKSDIADLERLLTHIQNNCPHEGLIGEYKGDTGNLDRGDDSYWVEFSCPVCTKYWREDQSDASYIRVNGVYEHVSKEGFVHRQKTKYDRD